MFTLTILVILIVFLLDILLSSLNYKHRHHPIPANVSDVYDQKEYARWLQYTMENHRLSMVEKTMDALILIVFLSIGFFPFLADLANGFTQHPIFQTLLFLGFYGAVSFVMGIGFHLYRTFSIEERYGFNQSSLKPLLLIRLNPFFCPFYLVAAFYTPC